MEYIQFVLKFSFILFFYIAIIGIFMRVAGYIGEKLGFGKFFLKLLQRIGKK